MRALPETKITIAKAAESLRSTVEHEKVVAEATVDIDKLLKMASLFAGCKMT